MEKFDLIVIGSGTGLDVANAAAQSGMKVAIVEKDRMGGTCLNRGCIPSKLLIHSADVMETVRSAGTFGINIDSGSISVDFQRIMARTYDIVDPDTQGILDAFEGVDNPRLFHTECRFTGHKTLAAGNETIAADKILIASGSRPAIPQIEGLEGTGFITSDQALRLKEQPKALTIIGGGYIACELGHFYGALGTKVNIIQRRNVLLVDEDEEISKKFTEVFARKHSVYTGYTPRSVSRKKDERNDNNNFVVTAVSPSTGDTIEVESDQLLVATGRAPNSDTLDLDRTGVRTDQRSGFVQVDQYLETNVEGIFALGDAIGRYMYKHSANHEAQYAYNNIVRQDRKVAVDYAAMPHAVFASPQVAGAGYTEQELREKKIHYIKSTYPYIHTAMGEAIDDRDGFVKFLVSPHDRKVLGCHIIGAQASVLIHEVLVAMRLGATVDAIARVVHIHPALSEVVSRAAGSVE